MLKLYERISYAVACPLVFNLLHDRDQDERVLKLVRNAEI